MKVCFLLAVVVLLVTGVNERSRTVGAVVAGVLALAGVVVGGLSEKSERGT